MKFTGEIPEAISPEWILSRVTQEEIFERYFGVRIRLNERFHSPFRRDRSPSCTFRYYGDKLRVRDWAKVGARTTQDCFDVVQELYSCDFTAALGLIARDFGLANVEPRYKPYRAASVLAQKMRRSQRADIQVRRRRWLRTDAQYLSSYGITQKTCEAFGVWPLEHVWLNGTRIWSHSFSDPALGYYLGTDYEGVQHWKVYFWSRKRGEGNNRFLGNTTRIQGHDQLDESGDHLVITKSLKDVLVLHEVGVRAIAPQSESVFLDGALLDDLRVRFGSLFGLYDRDRTGLRGLVSLRNQGVTPLLIPETYEQKDVSDLAQAHGLDEVRRLAEEVGSVFL